MLSFNEQELIDSAWRALEEEAKVPPEERFEEMVRSGLIDSDARAPTK